MYLDLEVVDVQLPNYKQVCCSVIARIELLLYLQLQIDESSEEGSLQAAKLLKGLGDSFLKRRAYFRALIRFREVCFLF